MNRTIAFSQRESYYLLPKIAVLDDLTKHEIISPLILKEEEVEPAIALWQGFQNSLFAIGAEIARLPIYSDILRDQDSDLNPLCDDALIAQDFLSDNHWTWGLWELDPMQKISISHHIIPNTIITTDGVPTVAKSAFLCDNKKYEELFTMQEDLIFRQQQFLQLLQSDILFHGTFSLKK